MTLRRACLTAMVLSSSWAGAATYYISPGGADANTGLTEAQAWGTFAFALTKLSPSDELVLADGHYEWATTGLLAVSCPTHRNGTANQAITVRALNSRRAWLDGAGGHEGLLIQGCSYWRFEGLRISGADVASRPEFYPANIEDSSQLVFRGLLVTHSNRYGNSKLFAASRSTDVLVEDSEFYWFHRAAFEIAQDTGLTARRIYVNSRGYPNIDGGYVCCDPTRGDVAFELWDSASGVQIENVISEGQHHGVLVSSIAGISNVRVSGSVSLGDVVGFESASNPGELPASNIALEQFAVVAPSSMGVHLQSTKDGGCDHCSVIGVDAGPSRGLLADANPLVAGDGLYQTRFTNSLVVNSPSGTGIEVLGQQTWTVQAANAYATSTPFAPWPGNFTAATQLDPGLGACLILLPPGSPMKGAGIDGGDVGANVLWRYQDGVQTCEPLWNPVTGAFPCGAIVPGVNDLPGSSCFDVHTRLQVNVTGCPLPADYATRCDGGAGGNGGGSGGSGGSPSASVLRVSCGCAEASGVEAFAMLGVGLLWAWLTRRPVGHFGCARGGLGVRHGRA